MTPARSPGARKKMTDNYFLFTRSLPDMKRDIRKPAPFLGFPHADKRVQILFTAQKKMSGCSSFRATDGIRTRLPKVA